NCIAKRNTVKSGEEGTKKSDSTEIWEEEIWQERKILGKKMGKEKTRLMYSLFFLQISNISASSSQLLASFPPPAPRPLLPILQFAICNFQFSIAVSPSSA